MLRPGQAAQLFGRNAGIYSEGLNISNHNASATDNGALADMDALHNLDALPNENVISDFHWFAVIVSTGSIFYAHAVKI